MDVIEQLIEAMQEELQSQEQMTVALNSKLDAMRHYDMPRLEALTLVEQRLVNTLQVQGGKRAQLAQQATRALNPPRQKTVATVRELAAVTKESQRERLLGLAALLGDAAEKTQRLNRVVGMASYKLMGHVNHIFQLIAHAGQDVGLYGRAGKCKMVEQNYLVDARA